jgi:hypothetical protein
MLPAMATSTQTVAPGALAERERVLRVLRAHEADIRTLKENLLWVRGFDTIEDLRLALHALKDTYNRSWIVERHSYHIPAAIRAAQLAPLPVAA